MQINNRQIWIKRSPSKLASVFSIWSNVLMRNCVDTLEEKSCVDLDREFLEYMLGPNCS